MDLKIAPIDATLGAVVTGLDLSRMDATRKNGLTRDCVVSCEMIGVYKT